MAILKNKIVTLHSKKMQKVKMELNAISLFSSSGIGDLGLKANNIRTVAACELLPDRMKLFLNNHSEAKGFCGDIFQLKDSITQYYIDNYSQPPFVILATPPCQGMSSNGMGTLLRNLKKGIRPKFDPRNKLIIPAVEIVKSLQPEWVIFENVPNMTNTVIEDGDGIINIIDYIYRELGDTYVGKPVVVDVADYGVPQHRKRLITILTKNKYGKDYFKSNGTLCPEPKFGECESIFVKRWKTLRDVIFDLPYLDSVEGKNVDRENPLHKVPLLDENKLLWISKTPEGQTAFSNQCINPECMYQGNRIHGDMHDADGTHKSSNDTPLYCEKCGALLPRPHIVDSQTGEVRLIKGFNTAYKRMCWDEPASTLTQNFQFVSSDRKIHPTQNRVLSLYEAMIIQTISLYPYKFEIDGKQVSDGLIRDSIGESVPPLLIDEIAKHILYISKKDS